MTLYVVAFSFAIYNDIFPLNILLISGFFIVFIVLFITFLLNSRLRIWLKRVLLLFTILIMILEVIFLQYGSNTIEFIKNINDNGKRIDEYGIYVLKSSKYNSLKDLSEKSFGYLAAEDENKIGQVLDKMDKEIDFSYHKVDEQNELLSKFKNGT